MTKSARGRDTARLLADFDATPTLPATRRR